MICEMARGICIDLLLFAFQLLLCFAWCWCFFADALLDAGWIMCTYRHITIGRYHTWDSFQFVVVKIYARSVGNSRVGSSNVSYIFYIYFFGVSSQYYIFYIFYNSHEIHIYIYLSIKKSSCSVIQFGSHFVCSENIYENYLYMLTSLI